MPDRHCDEEVLSLIRNVSSEHLCTSDDGENNEKVNGYQTSFLSESYSSHPFSFNSRLQYTLRSLRHRLSASPIPSSSKALTIVRHVPYALLPSFIHRNVRPGPSGSKTLHPTAFLDGMRGIAALLVVFCHLALKHFDTKYGYGAMGTDQYRNWLRLPIIRLFYTGQPMVCIFFIVSGYALSYKPLKVMRSRNHDKLIDLLISLSSSTFRRGFRLFLPTIVSTFIIMNMSYLGLFSLANNVAYGRVGVQVRTGVPRFSNYNAQISDWATCTFNFIDPFRWDFSLNSYDEHLWTIADEFRSSLFLFLTLLGVARMRSAFRMLTLGLLILYSSAKGRWQIILFYSGTMLAEWDMIRLSRALSQPPKTPLPIARTATNPSRILNITKIILSLVVFTIGLYLCSQPQKASESTPGWTYLASIEPDSFKDPTHPSKQHFWPSIGAFLLIATTSHTEFMKRMFDNAPVRYLGRISFALYLCHGALQRTVAAMAFGIAKRALHGSIPGAIIASSIAEVVVLIWMADLFTRAVDTPSVNFARWLEGRIRLRDE